MIDWSSYNKSLVRRGEIVFSYVFLGSWDYELDRINEGKKGKPFLFLDSFITALGYIRYSFHLPYKQTEGIIRATGKNLHEKPPSYGHICKRINKLNINITNDNTYDDDGHIIITIDSTGTKITNRGHLINKKWNVQNRKGYLKIHVAVNIETKEILALEVTDEKVHDGKMLKTLVDQVSISSSDKNNKAIRMKSVLADGVYDTNRNFQYLEEKRIKPGIKIRKNSIVSSKNNRLRNKEVMLQTNDMLKWETKRKYGHRWISENVFSTMKRTFGEHTSATRFQNMVKEMVKKVLPYKRLEEFRKLQKDMTK